MLLSRGQEVGQEGCISGQESRSDTWFHGAHGRTEGLILDWGRMEVGKDAP